MGTAATIARVNRKAHEWHIRALGDETLINGIASRGLWQPAQGERVQTFLDEADWKASAYQVMFPIEVLNGPWNLAVASSITWTKTGWTAVVRRIMMDNLDGQVEALVVLTTQQ